MPSFRGRIGSSDAWKLDAYVRALSGLTPKGTRSARADEMSGTTPTPQMEVVAPNESRIPPEELPPARGSGG
jgi:hypothetical protein